MTILNGTLQLHDIRNTEQYCNRIINNSNLNLTHHEQEDLLTYLITAAWQLSLTYQTNGKPSQFSTTAHPILKLRIIDWTRTTRGRTTWQFTTHTHTRQLPELVSTHTTEPTDATPDRSPDLMRILRT